MHYIIILAALVLTSCYTSKYTADIAPPYYLLLPPTSNMAQVIFSGNSLTNHIVIGYDSVAHYSAEPEFLAFYGQQFGAEKVMWLKVDTVADFYTWKQSCDTCDWYLSKIGQANSATKSIADTWAELKNKYDDVSRQTYYLHHVFLLAQPDSILPADRVLAIEIYDADDVALLSTIKFDWNEQVDTIEGDAFAAKRFLAVQPIGFYKQTNRDWQSYYNPNTNVLKRKNEKSNIFYRIEPDLEAPDSFRVFVSGGLYSRLTTIYYGQHDWTVGSASQNSSYLVDFTFDREGRIGYMYIKNRLYGGQFENHVRIYYRPMGNAYPQAWLWSTYWLATQQP